MYGRAFVATTIALGGTLDEALEALDASDEAPATMRMIPTHGLPELARGLRSTKRAERAAALAQAIHEVLLAVD